MRKNSIFSRILLLLGGLAVIGFSYWFLDAVLGPVSVPPTIVVRKEVRFDPAVDISKNNKFLRLSSFDQGAPDMQGLGRKNPFVPAVKVATTTQSATGTAQ